MCSRDHRNYWICFIREIKFDLSPLCLRLFRPASALALSVIIGLVWQPISPAAAAFLGQPPETTIYIVQPGDTLYDIAETFGITVENLAAANGIDRPELISVGQRLLIPPPPPPLQDVSLVHSVQAGETLHTLSLQYSVAEHELAQANRLIRADRLFVGQEITVRGHTHAPPPLSGRSYTLSSEETLAGLSVQHRLSPWLLAIENRLRSPYAAFAGQRVWLSNQEGVYFDWPDVFAGLEVHPAPAVRGESVAILITVTMPVTLTGSWAGAPLDFEFEQGTAAALAGIDAFAEPALYTLVVTASNGADTAAHYAQQVPIEAGDYVSESITVAPEIAAAMTVEVVRDETDLLRQLFSARTPRRWDGPFALPVAGDVTSSFGTRRTYNIAEASPYHTGTDFGAPVGTSVLAPANGIVIYTGALTVRGNVIILDHGWGVVTGYWHLSSILVSEDDVVTLGQHIGGSGDSGLSTGPHLHWEMRVGGVPVSALQWISEEFP